VIWARGVAERFMPELGRRWQHVQAVARLAESIALECASSELLVAAAYVHDIGYSRHLDESGFHPLDGARYLRQQGQEELARLVAHHSNARGEAKLRGIEGYEDEFPYGATLLDDALTVCDLTTSPDGEPVGLHDRVDEIVQRYGAQHVTARAIRAGLSDFERALKVVGELRTGRIAVNE
jgi:putative nucleotidyltransferase with HDIG domain